MVRRREDMIFGGGAEGGLGADMVVGVRILRMFLVY